MTYGDFVHHVLLCVGIVTWLAASLTAATVGFICFVDEADAFYVRKWRFPLYVAMFGLGVISFIFSIGTWQFALDHHWH